LPDPRDVPSLAGGYDFELLETTEFAVATASDLCRVVCFNERKIAALRRRVAADDGTRELSGVYKALGHPGRLAVLGLLALEECCVCDVANVLRMPLSTASQHLKALKSVGLIRPRPDGKLVFYSLAGPEVRRFVAEGEVRVAGAESRALRGGVR
jgi:ArsR family transcriptional regulator